LRDRLAGEMGGGGSKAAGKRKQKQQLAAAARTAAALASPEPKPLQQEPEPEPEPELEPEPHPQPKKEQASSANPPPLLSTPPRPKHDPSPQPTPEQAAQLGPPPDAQRVVDLTAHLEQAQAIQRAWRRRCVRVSLKAGATAMSESRRAQKLAAVFGHYDKDSTGRLNRECAVAMLSENTDDEPPTDESWNTLCGLLGVNTSDGISLDDLNRLYSAEVLGTTAAQHLDATLDRKFRALFPAHASPLRGASGASAGKPRRRRAKEKKRRKKAKGAPDHETTELQLRRMEAELRKLADQDPNDEDVRTLLDQTVAALEALRVEAQSSAEGTVSDPGSVGKQMAALPLWAGEQALGARIAAQGAQLAMVQGDSGSTGSVELTQPARIASLNTIAMEEMKIGQSASALVRLQEAWELVQKATVSDTGQPPSEQSVHLRATTLHNLGLWAASFGGKAGLRSDQVLPGADDQSNVVETKRSADDSEPLHDNTQQEGSHASGTGRKPSIGARSRSNGRAKSNGRGRRPPSGLRGQRQQIGMGTDVSRLPRVQRGPMLAHPRAVQSREESKLNTQEIAMAHPRPSRGAATNRRPLSRPMSAPANRQGTGIGPVGPGSRPRPSSARPVGRRNNSSTDSVRSSPTRATTRSPADWSAPSIEDRRAFAVETHQSGLTVTEPKALHRMYGAGSASAFRQPGQPKRGMRLPVAAAWEGDDDDEGVDPAAESSTSAVPARPTDHETTRRSEHSPLSALSLSSIGSAASLAIPDTICTTSPHGDWLRSTDPQTGATEALAARRLQMDTKPWRQTGRRRKPKPDSEQEGQLPPETYEGGTFARMERTHKASEKVDAFWSTKVRPHESPTRSREKIRAQHRAPDTTGRDYADPAHAAIPAQKRWTPAGAKLSPQKDRPRVSMAVPRHLKPVRQIGLLHSADSPLSLQPPESLNAQTKEEPDAHNAHVQQNNEKEQESNSGENGKARSEDKEPQESKSSEEDKEPSLGVDMGLEEAVRVTAHGCLIIADIVRKSTGAAARRVSEIDTNIANNSSRQGQVASSVSAAEIQKRRSAVESSAHRMSAAAYILEKLQRTLDGEHLGADMAALREYAENAPRALPEDSSVHIMVSSPSSIPRTYAAEYPCVCMSPHVSTCTLV
jgi:hypothetical protein